MGLILLEALGALVLLLAIVWWTMFAGRRRGELRSGDASQPSQSQSQSQSQSGPDALPVPHRPPAAGEAPRQP